MAEAEAPAAAPEDSGAEAGGKGKRLWLWLTIAVLVLGGAGGGYWYYAYYAAGEAADAGKPEAERGPPLYVALDPPFVVNFETEQLVRFLQVSVQLMTRDAPTSELLKAHDPVIRNDLLMLFANQQYASVSTRAGKEKLRREALETVRRALAVAGGQPELVEAVYFTSFVMQ